MPCLLIASPTSWWSNLLLIESILDQTQDAVWDDEMSETRFCLNTFATTSFFTREVAMLGRAGAILDALVHLSTIDRREATTSCAPPAS